MYTFVAVIVCAALAQSALSLENDEILQRLRTIEKTVGDLKAHVYNNTDLEERVTVLEESVADLELGLAGVSGEVDDIRNEVVNLQESQNIQDERFLSVEDDIDQLNTDVAGQEERLTSLEATSLLHGQQISGLEEANLVLEVKVSVLESTDIDILDRLSDLESADLDNRVTVLEWTTDQLVNETVEAEQRLDTLDESVADLTDQVNSIEDVNSGQSDQISALQAADEDIEARLEVLESGVTLNEPIGFHAQLSTATVPAGTIVFGNVYDNVGNRYDSSTGIFTADRIGLYFFYYYLEIDHDSTVTLAYLYKNSSWQCVTEGGGHSLSEVEQMISCGAAIPLVPGDEVYVTISVSNAIEAPSSCGFTGFLIQEYF